MIVLEAAMFLLKVAEDPELYSSYFWWKDYYSHVRSRRKVRAYITNIFSIECSPQAWCSLCASLHDGAGPVSTVPDLSQWWVHEAQCEHLGERTNKLLWELQKWMAG